MKKKKILVSLFAAMLTLLAPFFMSNAHGRTVATLPVVPRPLYPRTSQYIDVSPHTLSWHEAANAVTYQVKVDGPGVHWRSAPIAGQYVDVSFSYWAGEKYTWNVRACYDTSCDDVSAWSLQSVYYWQYSREYTPIPVSPENGAIVGSEYFTISWDDRRPDIASRPGSSILDEGAGIYNILTVQGPGVNYEWHFPLGVEQKLLGPNQGFTNGATYSWQLQNCWGDGYSESCGEPTEVWTFTYTPDKLIY